MHSDLVSSLLSKLPLSKPITIQVYVREDQILKVRSQSNSSDNTHPDELPMPPYPSMQYAQTPSSTSRPCPSLLLRPKIRPYLLGIPLSLTILPNLLMLLAIPRCARPRPTRRSSTRRRSMIRSTITLHKARRNRRRSRRNGRRLSCRGR